MEDEEPNPTKSTDNGSKGFQAFGKAKSFEDCAEPNLYELIEDLLLEKQQLRLRIEHLEKRMEQLHQLIAAMHHTYLRERLKIPTTANHGDF